MIVTSRMRWFTRVLLIVTAGLMAAACAQPEAQPTAVATPSPVPPTTVAPAPTATSAATPTPLPTPTTAASPTPCLEFTEPSIPPVSGPLRVIYSNEGKLWLWKEELKKAEPFPLPEDATDPRLSDDDGLLIAYQRVLNDEESEIWVSNSDGSEARKLATASTAETRQRYPNAVDVEVAHSWLPGTHTIAYTFRPIFDAIGTVPSEAVYLVDANTGQSRQVVPPGEVHALAYAPDGGQIAARASDELRLIDARDGSVQFRIPLQHTESPDQSMAYSPDGKYVVIFAEGITIVNSSDGSRYDIPFQYTPIGVGHGSAMPGMIWKSPTEFYTIVANTENVFGNPAATFTVWQVALPGIAQASAIPVRTYTGFFFSRVFSPDLRYLAYWSQQDNHRKLYLADIVSGEQVLYDEGNLIEFLDWNPDSTRFAYWFFGQKQPLLGHVCQRPQSLDKLAPGSRVEWVDAERLLTVHGDERHGEWELRLQSMGGESIPIATVSGDYPSYSFYFHK